MDAGNNGYSDWRADRDVRRLCPGAVPLFAGVLLLCGCSLTQVRGVDGSVVEQNELYSGEPVAVHATEIPVTSAEEARARARTALIARDTDLALYFYVQAVSLDPEDIESFYAIGAIRSLRRALTPRSSSSSPTTRSAIRGSALPCSSNGNSIRPNPICKLPSSSSRRSGAPTMRSGSSPTAGSSTPTRSSITRPRSRRSRSWRRYAITAAIPTTSQAICRTPRPISWRRWRSTLTTTAPGAISG